MRMGPLLVPLLRCSSLPHTLSLGPTKPAFQELIEYLGSSFHLTLRHALWPELSGLHMRCDLDPGNCRAPRVPPLGPPEVGHKRHRFQGPQQPLEVRPPGPYPGCYGSQVTWGWSEGCTVSRGWGTSLAWPPQAPSWPPQAWGAGRGCYLEALWLLRLSMLLG
jgi:hypothetical protein